MIKFFSRTDDSIFNEKRINNISSQKTYNDTCSIPSPNYKISKEYYNNNIISQIEEDLLKSLNINCELMNTIYQIQFKLLNTDNTVQLNEIKKIIKIIERKKIILINTTKNFHKLVEVDNNQNQINNYVLNFNKLLNISIKLIDELQIH